MACVVGLFAVLFASSCDLFDDDGASRSRAPDDTRVVRLLLIDTGLSRQSIMDPGLGIQVAEWEVDSATLEIDGNPVDLLRGEPCSVDDTAIVAPVTDGPCENGVVVDDAEGIEAAVLTLGVFDVRVRRAEPVPIGSFGSDFDGDGVPDDGNGNGSVFDDPCEPGETSSCDYNCPLVFNPGQADANGYGIGAACTTRGSKRDSDADGVADDEDNCVWIPNPGQENTVGVTNDGIGDACPEQVAQVEVAGRDSFTVTLEPNRSDRDRGLVVFATVDFNSSSALDCDWSDWPSCTLDPNQLLLCISDRKSDALLGCAS